MSGGYAYPQYGPPPAPIAVGRLAAAGLLAVAALLAVAGSFGAFSIYTIEGMLREGVATTTLTGWSVYVDPPNATPLPSTTVPYGVPVVVAGVLAFIAAVLLAVTSRTVADPAAARALGVGSGGVLLGVVLVIWTQLGTHMRNAAEFSAENGGGYTYEVGVGGYLVLVAALLALAAAVVLLVSRHPAPQPVPPGPGGYPQLGPQWQPQAPPQPPHWQTPPPSPPHRS